MFTPISRSRNGIYTVIQSSGSRANTLPVGSPRLALLCFATIAFVGGFFRFVGLTEVGIGGNDTIYYYTLAEYWSRGHFVFSIGDSVKVSRPVLLSFNTAALQLLGHTDYAIKWANAGIDTLNIVLVGLLAWLSSRRWRVTIAAATVYAATPMALWAARIELPHVLSTTCVLLAAISLCASIERNGVRSRSAWAFGAGLGILLATLTHEELILLATPFCLTLLLDSVWIRQEAWLASLLMPALAALAPLVGVVLLLSAGSAEVADISASAGEAPTILFTMLERMGRNLTVALVVSFSWVSAVLILAASVLLVIKTAQSDRLNLQQRILAIFLIGTPLIAIALYSLFFASLFPRNVLPLVPLWLTVLCWAPALALQRPWTQGLTLALVTLVTVGSNLSSYHDFKVANRRFGHEFPQFELPSPENWERSIYRLSISANYDTETYWNHWRNIHTALKDRVNEKNRLLVVPSTVFYAPGRRALQTDAYFGDDAIYRLDHTGTGLAQLVREKQIKFVIWTTGQLRRPPTMVSLYQYDHRWGTPETIDLAASLGIPAYSEQSEGNSVLRFLQRVGAKQLRVFEAGSWDQGRARVFELPDSQ